MIVSPVFGSVGSWVKSKLHAPPIDQTLVRFLADWYLFNSRELVNKVNWTILWYLFSKLTQLDICFVSQRWTLDKEVPFLLLMFPTRVYSNDKQRELNAFLIGMSWLKSLQAILREVWESVGQILRAMWDKYCLQCETNIVQQPKFAPWQKLRKWQNWHGFEKLPSWMKYANFEK